MSTHYEKHLVVLLDKWFETRKTLMHTDYKMLKDLVYEKVNK